MKTYGMGWTPYRNHINLCPGYDWIFSRTKEDGPFTAGTIVEIVWDNGVTWPATIEGDTASWRIEAAAVAAIPDGTGFEIAVRYPNSATSTTDDYPWIIGTCRYLKK